MSDKKKNIITWVLVILLGSVFIMAGITKLMGVEMQVKNIESWQYPAWFIFPIGLTDLLLGLALFIPKFRRLAVYGIFCWTVVAVFTHLRVGQTEMIGAPLLFGAVALVIFFLSRNATTEKK